MSNKPLVLITGASSGMGAATARAFDLAGYPTLIIARRLELLKKLNLSHAQLLGADVRDVNAIEAAIAEAEAKFGEVDLLVNNAGIMPLGAIQTQNNQEWRSMFEVNVLSLLEITQLVLPKMTARSHGTIINIGSVAGRNIYDNHAAYCGSKFAVHAISEGMRKEVANRNVRVTVIAPGMVETELLNSTDNPEVVAGYQEYKQSIGGAMPAHVVASLILSVYEQPQEICIREIVLAPTQQDA